MMFRFDELLCLPEVVFVFVFFRFRLFSLQP